MALALQLGKNLRKGHQAYLAALVEVKSDQLVEVPDEVAQLLGQSSDVMPLELHPTIGGPIWCACPFPEQTRRVLRMCIDYEP